MLGKLFDGQRMFDKYVNSREAKVKAQTEEIERQKADERVKNIKEHYLTAIINNKTMTMDTYCSSFNIPENEIKELGYDALQKGLITKDSASTFFELPVDEIESQLKSYVDSK